jgi:hypothetical protein
MWDLVASDVGIVRIPLDVSVSGLRRTLESETLSPGSPGCYALAYGCDFSATLQVDWLISQHWTLASRPNIALPGPLPPHHHPTRSIRYCAVTRHKHSPRHHLHPPGVLEQTAACRRQVQLERSYACCGKR